LKQIRALNVFHCNLSSKGYVYINKGDDLNQFQREEIWKMETIKKRTTPREEGLTMIKKIRARICHNCPLCNHARKNPESRIGKMLHHTHADNCPFWKAEKEVYQKRDVRKLPELNSHMMWKTF
jgi:hypothetical protein